MKLSDRSVLEKDWVTTHGNRAIVVDTTCALPEGHRCGYVEIPADHWLYEVPYNADLEGVSRDVLMDDAIGKRGPIDIMIFSMGKTVRPADLFDVHGSLTFSGIPVGIETGFWYGFDCSHADDTREICTLDYCFMECERLSAQLMTRWAKRPDPVLEGYS